MAEKTPALPQHFTPTSASWLNQVERFFAEITRKRIRRGVFKSVPELEATIDDYLAKHNETSKPFNWTATAQDICKKSGPGARCPQAGESGYLLNESEH